MYPRFMGEILNVKTEEDVLDERGMLDLEKVRPFLYVPESNTYYGTGEYLGKAFSIGRDAQRNP